ncbi:MAG: redoxin family protein [Pseudomonadota bacterium]|nr:redoxin family protein [Pseudomonadota bacterium]
MLILLALACSSDSADTAGKDPLDTDSVEDTGTGDTDTDTDDTDTDDTEDPGPSCAEEPPPPDVKDTGDEPWAAETLTGAVTWTLSFDAEAEALGFVDCTYTRAYSQTEVGDQGYLCPDCTLLSTGTAVMTDGYEACFLQISSAESERVEHLGLGEIDGETHLFRSGSENVSLADMGAVVAEEAGFAVAWEDESALEDGGNMVLAAAGTLTLGVSADAWVADVTGARTEPYSCGWTMNNPGGPNSSWSFANGERFPNVRLDDQCGDAVDLWDFLGHYLVIDSSSPDCGPCQSMAEGAEAFKARMEAACAPIEMVTLLNESLGAINQPAAPDVLQEWADTFGLTSPVLADKGAGYALFPEYLGIESGMSYPAVVLLDPDGNVLYGSTGFGDWSEFEAIILADWEARGG